MNNSEKLLSAFAEKTFFKEFVMDDLCFTPESGSEIELADLLINLDSYIIAIQLKARNQTDQTDDKNIENKWLSKKCKNAKAQVKETLRLISSGSLPPFKNKRGQSIVLRTNADVIPLVVFENEKIDSYPHLLRKHSDEGMDINCMSFQDFKEMCSILVTPFEIILYLDYRKNFYKQYGDVDIFITETTRGFSISKPSKKETLAHSFLLERYGSWELSHQKKKLLIFSDFMHSLPSHTVMSSIEDGNYAVLLFLARLDRKEICEFIDRLVATRKKSKHHKFGALYSLRRADNEYAIIFVAGGVLKMDFLLSMVRQKADVKRLMEVSVYWESKTDFRIDFLFWDNSETLV